MKIRNLFISFIMLFTLTAYTSCGKGANDEVQLVSVNGSRSVVYVEKEVNKAKDILKANETTTVGGAAITEEGDYSLDTLGNNLLILPTSVMHYDITINLNNPYDHSIQDFRIQTTDTTLKMYNSNLDRWDVIDTTKSIKWLGADNQSFKFTLLSASEESVTSIKITEILYLNRSAQRVENVNLSTGPDYVDVVKADRPSIEKVKVYQDSANYITVDYRVNFGKGTKNVKLDGELAEEGKVYTTKYGNHPKLTWEFLYKETTINATYEKELYTSLSDLYGIRSLNCKAIAEENNSFVYLEIEYDLYESPQFDAWSSDLKFNIRRNGEKEKFEIISFECREGYYSMLEIYHCKFSQEIDWSDNFSVYILNGEEEILLVL